MPIVNVLVQLATRFSEILIAPIKQPDMLWILIPIYLNWVFTDYFQERKGTDFGNAMTNGAVALWAGMDWIRQTVKISEFGITTLVKIGIGALFILYGLFIMIESAKAKPIAKYIGRVREVSYFMIVTTPIFYSLIPIDLITLAAILLFFPIFYGLAELIDRLLPTPPGEDVINMPDIKVPDLEPSTELSKLANSSTPPKMSKF
ncbi:MAG: hypothetical protein QW063_02695 [Candidatus Nanoarchaeia archaeon]